MRTTPTQSIFATSLYHGVKMMPDSSEDEMAILGKLRQQ